MVRRYVAGAQCGRVILVLILVAAGYDAHPCVILDDFRPEWCKLSFLLRLLDRYAMRVPFKGGFRQWKPVKIWITCPKHPEECYLESAEDNAQLIRRLTVIKEFTN